MPHRIVFIKNLDNILILYKNPVSFNIFVNQLVHYLPAKLIILIACGI